MKTFSKNNGKFKLKFIKKGETEPFKVVEFTNLVVDTGTYAVQDMFIGLGGTAFDVDNAHIGSGDDDTIPDADQTDLQAVTNKGRVPCTDVSRTDNTVLWETTFGYDDCNWEWKEVGVFNALTSGTMFCRALVPEDDVFTKTDNFTVIIEYSWTLT